MKKILIIFSIITLIVLAIAAWWYFIIRGTESPVNDFINGLPFGSGDDTSLPQQDSGQVGASNQPEETGQNGMFSDDTTKLFRISDTPVAGFILIKKGDRTVARYLDRATGHIYDAYLPSGTSTALVEKIKITNNTLPKIYEAYFRSDGNAVLVRYLKNNSDVIENLSLALTAMKKTSTSSQEALNDVSATAIRGNIGAVAVGNAANTIFYSIKDSLSIVSSAFNGTGLKSLYSSPFTEWRLEPSGNNLLIYSKASAGVDGYAYILNTSTRALAKILGPLNGLSVKPNRSGNRIIYSYKETTAGYVKTIAKNMTSGALYEILPSTFAEKCVWSSKKIDFLFCGAPDSLSRNGEPDNWYRGITHFSDRIWLINSVIGNASVLSDPDRQFKVEVDVVKPGLSPDENYFAFINKNDLSLWALKLESF